MEAPEQLSLIKFFRAFAQSGGMPHQYAAIAELERVLAKEAPHIMQRSSEWFEIWMVAGREPLD